MTPGKTEPPDGPLRAVMDLLSAPEASLGDLGTQQAHAHCAAWETEIAVRSETEARVRAAEEVRLQEEAAPAPTPPRLPQGLRSGPAAPRKCT